MCALFCKGKSVILAMSIKRRFLVFAVLAVGVILSSAFTALHISGYIYATGSPFDGASCAQCHSGGATTPTVAVTAAPAFGSGNTYVPGSTYTITVTVSGSYAKYGFNTEVLDSNSPSAVNDAGVCGPAVSSNCSRFTSSTLPTNYTHNVPSGSAGSATFSFQWTAPASGPVYIYTAGLGVNNNGADNGDKVKTNSLVLSPTVGINAFATAKIKFAVYPNPAIDKVRISFYARQNSTVNIQLYDLEGNLVKELLQTTCAYGPQIMEVPLPEGLAHANYLLKLRVNNEEALQKLSVY